MRFEIRAGGGFLILAGLVGLSGAVFALGLVAGYEMARQTQPDVSQISSTYPLPNPPEKPAPVSEMSPAAEASPASGTSASTTQGMRPVAVHAAAALEAASDLPAPRRPRNIGARARRSGAGRSFAVCANLFKRGTSEKVE